ncbi:MAG: hypothetical protein A2007_05090 [Verrucomicrobia bacterium GWC2_42_7]|nr:MAG: hypothetical protein A2007_05090 [Verrucomicrobia bacterium GWC2_42_7]
MLYIVYTLIIGLNKNHTYLKFYFFSNLSRNYYIFFIKNNPFGETALGCPEIVSPTEKRDFNFRVRWAADSHSVTYGCTLPHVHLAHLLEKLN